MPSGSSHLPKTTVESYARQWLENNTERRPSTRTRYESSLRYYILAEPLVSASTRRYRTRIGIGDVQLVQLGKRAPEVIRELPGKLPARWDSGRDSEHHVHCADYHAQRKGPGPYRALMYREHA